MAWSFRTSSGEQKTAVTGSTNYAVRVYRTSTQFINDGVWTSVAFDNEHYDYGGMHSTVTNNSRLIAPVSGIYNISGSFAWAAEQSGDRFARILFNGTTPLSNSGAVTSSGVGNFPISAVKTSYFLVAGQYVELQANQTSGGSLGLAGTFTNAGLSQPHFEMNLADTATVMQPTIPIGTVLDYYGTVLPSGYLWCNGSAIPAQYSAAIAIIGANTPDLRGRTTAGLDNIGGSEANRLDITGSGISDAQSKTLGHAAGAAAHALTVAEMPQHNHPGTTATSTAPTASATAPSASGTVDVRGANETGILGGNTPVATTAAATTVKPLAVNVSAPAITVNAPTITVTVAAQGSTSAHPNMQPTLLVNKIIRVEA